MKHSYIKIYIALILLSFFTCNIYAQALKSIELQWDNGLSIKSFNRFQIAGYPLPLVTFLLNDSPKSTANAQIKDNLAVIDNKLSVSYLQFPGFHPGLKAEITFINISKDTLRLANVVPFGESEKHVYITAKGKPGLSGTHLFRPGYEPVNVIVPDNAWELGFATVNVDNGSSICALVRRNTGNTKNASRRRFETVIYPGGSVSYNLWMEAYIGTWQEGLRLMFHDRMLYDVEPGTFDNHLYERKELNWIRHAYVGHFVSAWDQHFYSWEQQRYTFPEFEQQTELLYGGDDYNIIWHGFPMLGMDQRNQWDMFRDMPGGISKMRELSDQASKSGSSFMISYKPWDLPAGGNQLFNSTRYKDPVQGLSELTKEANLRGVMYDTRSESSEILQKGIEKVRPDFVIFPEGMCVPADMQNCVIGRVHAALTYAPMLNLNKLIKPEFTIFRQVVITKESVKRDFATSFFNGYGVEIHLKVSPQLAWMQDLYKFLGQTTRILRENSDLFIEGKQVPLLPTTADKIWVNGWLSEQKNIYNIYCTNPDGFNGTLFEVDPQEKSHLVDLWNNEEIAPVRVGGKQLATVSIAGFNPAYLGTENEGASGCIAQFPSLISFTGTQPGNMTISSKVGSKISIWKGNPSFQTKPVELKPGKYLLSTILGFSGYQGKLVVQLFKGNDLLDQRVFGKSSISQPETVEFAKSEGKTSYESENLSVQLFRQQDILKVSYKRGSKVEVSPRDLPSHPAAILNQPDSQVKLLEKFGRYEGDFIVRLFDNQNKVIEQCSIYMPYGSPRLAFMPVKTATSGEIPSGMVRVPSGNFKFKAAHIGDWDLKYPLEDTGKVFVMKEYYMDKYPVTNGQFKEFIQKSNYKPTDHQNFLKNWVDGQVPAGQENFAVVYVSYEDARAYASWAGKRLPTENEWQYAAQNGDDRKYPWGNEKDSTGVRCNPGNGIPDPVGKYPQGVNPSGISDLTGSVWQITNDLYKTGVIDYFILKGGCYFTTLSSWWYVKGGPLPLINRQQQYRVSQGYERAATIGFRCVKDAI
jgi:formylglycine-generating enzyme required for sulfatase activity